ncbi:hypothetical protein [Streptomyces palmae]|uniref:Uncharacterized protein n=1 Tax=Streptomyces palmae TaxID=1701085 RepID=A0A4Z0HCC8_9ACTN|nr:hypothetical protein [Streptomyces palmae]TGB10830.1 hypothetical protein E4099_12520 [Streptomyces palmae]
MPGLHTTVLWSSKTSAPRGVLATPGQYGEVRGAALTQLAEARAALDTLERDAASYRERQRAERARDRAGEAWCRANAPPAARRRLPGGGRLP